MNEKKSEQTPVLNIHSSNYVCSIVDCKETAEYFIEIFNKKYEKQTVPACINHIVDVEDGIDFKVIKN